MLAKNVNYHHRQKLKIKVLKCIKQILGLAELPSVFTEAKVNLGILNANDNKIKRDGDIRSFNDE